MVRQKSESTTPRTVAANTLSPLPKRLAILLLAITTLTFAPILPQPFAPIDDVLTIAGNKRLNPAAWNSESILYYWDHPELGLYIPMTYTAWGLLSQATYVPTPDEQGLHVEPSVFHAASLLTHLLAILAVYAILLRLLPAILPTKSRPLTALTTPEPEPKATARIEHQKHPNLHHASPWPPFAGGLLSALHPLQVESVAWASGLKDVLAGALSLTAIALYLQMGCRLRLSANRSTANTPTPSPPFYLLATLAFTLAILSKPSAIVTPLLILIIDFLLLRQPLRRTLVRMTPWLLLAIPIAIIAKIVQPGEGIATPRLYERPIVAGASIAFYLGKLLLPTNLAFDHGWRPLDMLRLPWFWIIATIPLLLAIALLIFRQRPSARPLAASALILTVALAPVLGLTPFLYQESSTVADHYMYLPMLGPALAAAWLLAYLAVIPSRRKPLAGIVATLLGILSLLTVLQIRHWRSPEVFARRMIAVNPSGALGHTTLARLLMDQRRWPEAETELSAAIAANPNYLIPRLHRVTLYSALGRVDDAIAAMHDLRRVNLFLPKTRQKKMDDVFYQAGLSALKINQPAQAARYLEEALKENPTNPAIQSALEKARATPRPK